MPCIDCDHDEERREDWKRLCNQSEEFGRREGRKEVLLKIEDYIISEDYQKRRFKDACMLNKIKELREV